MRCILRSTHWYFPPPSKASHWCEEGIFLLANQPVDRCQSQDGAEAALQELERYLDTASLHTLTDRSAICCQYEAVLNSQLRVREKIFSLNF